MAPMLRLYEDLLANGKEVSLPALPRMIYVAHGALGVAGVSLREDQALRDDQSLRDDQAWAGEGAVTLKAGAGGACLWRWELTEEAGTAPLTAAGIVSREKLAARLDTIPKGSLLLRGDSVGFPPGGCAYLHRHQGPGIRCLVEGGIRIDTRGHSASYGPGSAWYETGPDGVFAQAAERPTRFVRVMILPSSYVGRSSVEYLNEEDKAKPKVQQYKIFADLPLTWAST